MLCTYPLEHMAAVTPRVNPEPAYRIYDALAEPAGVRRPVRVGDPRVSADDLVRSDGTRFAVLVGQADAEPTVRLLVAGNGGAGDDRFTLGPYGVRVLELRT
ncbi:hypothetical protein NE235_33910 [Actinoallomurus spadix]|uniref:Uncharacterized protein n=1 Tax=Actinoallomurus spadix TaxID=79912 RepID=A0ABN0XT53_9ACTN|nr:hypothetical protein [Actinoallomurus spadix]MCO5991118.1 hypothetical protein [Actinoallomurus spadix]